MNVYNIFMSLCRSGHIYMFICMNGLCMHPCTYVIVEAMT